MGAIADFFNDGGTHVGNETIKYINPNMPVIGLYQDAELFLEIRAKKYPVKIKLYSLHERIYMKPYTFSDGVRRVERGKLQIEPKGYITFQITPIAGEYGPPNTIYQVEPVGTSAPRTLVIVKVLANPGQYVPPEHEL